ncbi:transmembrane protein 176B-like isoform X2 [Ambystoma mexicanum]|uniref:transmembrane protein 176B-like isoform X2 n=1 Tax=Ambystoma mexicanum TaxID=8296 RepID=UPI0037E8376D
MLQELEGIRSHSEEHLDRVEETFRDPCRQREGTSTCFSAPDAADSPLLHQTSPEQEVAMSSNIVRVNGVEMVSEASKPTVINININQPTSLSCPMGFGKNVLKGLKPSSVLFRGEQKVLGAVQIIIGLVCVSFAVMLCFVRVSLMYHISSCFWTGFPFIVTGIASILSESRASCFWHCVAFVLHLLSVSVAIAALCLISYDLNPYYWSYISRWNPDEICNTQSSGGYRGYYRGYYETTTPEPYNWKVEECKNVLLRLLNMFLGMTIVFVVSNCLALCISLYSLGYRIKSLCCACVSEQLCFFQEEEEATLEKAEAAACHPAPALHREMGKGGIHLDA